MKSRFDRNLQIGITVISVAAGVYAVALDFVGGLAPESARNAEILLYFLVSVAGLGVVLSMLLLFIRRSRRYAIPLLFSVVALWRVLALVM